MTSAIWRLLAWWRPRREGDGTDLALPPDASDPVAQLCQSLTAEARPHELTGLAEPLALFRATVASTSAPTPSPTMRRIPVLSSLMSARAGAAVAGIAIGLGGTAVVAYSATRPPTTAPASTETPSAKPSPGAKPSDRPVGPDATGPAASGLCRAWSNHQKHDDGVERAEGSVAMRNLATAAGGEAKIEAFCAKVDHPGNGPKPKEDGTAGRSGKDKPTPQGPKDKATPADPEDPSPSPKATPSNS